MADISKIQLPDGTSYDLKDKTSGYITASEAPDVSRFIPTTTNSTAIDARDGFRLDQYSNTSTGGFRRLTLGNEENYLTSEGAYGVIRFYDGTKYYRGDLLPNLNLYGDQTWTLPAKTGTIALTSDIPDTSTLITNPSTKTTDQYLQYNGTNWIASDLPIYDGTVDPSGVGVQVPRVCRIQIYGNNLPEGTNIPLTIDYMTYHSATEESLAENVLERFRTENEDPYCTVFIYDGYNAINVPPFIVSPGDNVYPCVQLQNGYAITSTSGGIESQPTTIVNRNFGGIVGSGFRVTGDCSIVVSLD